MKNCLELGDRIKILVDKTTKTPLGTFVVKKSSIYTICDVSDNFVSIEVTNSDGYQDTMEFSLDEIELVEK